MNITAGISDVAELEVSELHCPALVLPIHIKLYKLLNLSCSKMGSAKNKKNQRVSRENSGNAYNHSAGTENTSKRRISVLAVAQILYNS